MKSILGVIQVFKNIAEQGANTVRAQSCQNSDCWEDDYTCLRAAASGGPIRKYWFWLVSFNWISSREWGAACPAVSISSLAICFLQFWFWGRQKDFSLQFLMIWDFSGWNWHETIRFKIKVKQGATSCTTRGIKCFIPSQSAFDRCISHQHNSTPS